MNKLDFSLLPNLQYAKAWITLDEGIEELLSHYPETLERAEASLKFAWFMSSTDKVLCCKKDDSLKAREAFLRAALSEFSSMEEALERDLKKIKGKHSPLKIRATKNPILHITKEFRNLEIHLRSSKLSSEKLSVIIGNINKIEGRKELKHEIFIVDDLTDATFNMLQNSKHYNKNDKLKLISWFNNAQKEWGIIELVIRSVNIYSSIIIKEYGIQKTYYDK